MAKITRVLQKIFGQNASAGQLGKIGSLAAGNPETTANPVDMQSLSNYLEGMYSVVLGQNSPAIEDINALHFLATRQLAYIMQAGVPEWDAQTEYYIGSYVNVSGTLYRSITDNNIGNLVTDSANWSVSLLGASVDNALLISQGVNGGVQNSAVKVTPAGSLSGLTDMENASSAVVWNNHLRPVGQTVGLGGIAESAVIDLSLTTSNTDIAASEIVLTTKGNPIRFFLDSRKFITDASFVLFNSTESSSVPGADLVSMQGFIKQGSTNLQRFIVEREVDYSRGVRVGPQECIDTVISGIPAGTHTFKISAQKISFDGTTMDINECVFKAYEL